MIPTKTIHHKKTFYLRPKYVNIGDLLAQFLRQRVRFQKIAVTYKYGDV